MISFNRTVHIVGYIVLALAGFSNVMITNRFGLVSVWFFSLIALGILQRSAGYEEGWLQAKKIFHNGKPRIVGFDDYGRD